jgi:hypothetical protein
MVTGYWQPGLGGTLKAIIRTVAAALVVLAVGACSRHYSTGINEVNGKQRIYTVSDAEADAIAHGAIVSSFPGRRVEVISGPVRGYSTYTRMMLDTFTQQVLIKPVSGETAEGRSIDGYIFEVSGSGTSVIVGGIQNSNFADTLQRTLDGTGRAVDVVSTSLRLAASWPPQQPSKGGGDTAQQLRVLKDLSDQGLISADEYDQKRRDLLSRI